MAEIVRIDELEKIDVAGVHWRPIRRRLGITAFGINAYTADAGEQLIEPHDETGSGHQELYVILAGRATFTVGGSEVDAPAGTIVHLDDPAERREAVAAEDGTTAMALGGAPGTITPSAWEHRFYAASTDDPAARYEIVSGALADHPDDPSTHFDLACHAAQAGQHETAFEHLARAVEGNPRAREWAKDDADLDPIRDDPRFQAL